MSEDKSRTRRPRGRKPRRKVCQFCVDKIQHIDYKDLPRLRRFTTERGKILPRRMTGNCAKHQRQLSIGDQACPRTLRCCPTPQSNFCCEMQGETSEKIQTFLFFYVGRA